MGETWLGALYFADDLVLAVEKQADMQKMLRVLDEYSRQWKFQVSAPKTKVLRFSAMKGI